MAQQRHGQRHNHHIRRSRWRAMVAAGVCGLLIACGGGDKGPLTGLPGDPVTPPGQGGGGGGNLDALVGQWLNTLILQVGGDYQRIETTWIFGNEDSCSRTVETFSIQEDRLHFSQRRCTYLTNSRELAILYSDAQETIYFDFHFPEFSRDAVVIDQFRFRRIF